MPDFANYRSCIIESTMNCKRANDTRIVVRRRKGMLGSRLYTSLIALGAVIAMGCNDRQSESTERGAHIFKSNDGFADIDDIELRMIAWGPDQAIIVPESDYDKDGLISALRSLAWQPEDESKPEHKHGSDAWQIELSANGKKKRRLNAVPLRQGHLFYDPETRRHLQSDCLDNVLGQLIESDPERWTRKLDQIYFRDGNYGKAPPVGKQ